MKNLLIVESPAKAKTIEKYLGKDFKVEASYGHIRDLPKGDKAIDIQNGYQPTYEVPADKRDRVKELQKAAKEAEEIWLATDEDREGEAISWHLAQVLGLDPHNTKRIVFSEITKSAIQNAIKSPRTLDLNLVNAQQARRVLDRLVGFKLSPVLWKKVKAGLSAGRVQSVAVRLIVEREREITNFQPEPYFKLQAELWKSGDRPFKAELKQRLKEEREALAYLESSRGARFAVEELQKKPSKRKPAPPFTTSTLQQEAARKLSFPVGLTMRVAQSLYEDGHITYMRTDSVNLSNQALAAMDKVIKSEFGEKYHQFRRYKTKKGNAQEAHEAIRPTDFNKKVAGKDANAKKLYELIWKRAVASQMADAELERTVVTISVQPQEGGPLLPLTATGEIIIFDGFLKLYLESRDDEDDEDGKTQDLLPELKVGDELQINQMHARQRYTRGPARYTEASLVKKLEELGIGRPSTYAPTISTVQKRNYVVKEEKEGEERQYVVLTLQGREVDREVKTEITGRERNKLSPTDLGVVVTDFLSDHFKKIMDYSFTAKVEEEFDKIAEGDLAWNQMIDHFYQPFIEQVSVTEEQAQRASGERHLGTDPETGKPIIARIGRYGPLVQIGDAEDPEKRFASLVKGQRLETITLQEALKLFELPREVGTYEEEPMEANIGRYGPYVKHKGKFYSIPRGGTDPFTIGRQEAIEIIEAKRERDRNRIIREFPEEKIQILRGRWGPYISTEDDNVRIPKDQKDKAADFTLEEVKQLIEEHKNKPKKGAKKKTTAKKSSSKTTKSKKSTTKAKSTTKKTTAKKSTPKKTTAKKSGSKKTAAKKSPSSKNKPTKPAEKE